MLINTWSVGQTQRRREKGAASWEYLSRDSTDNQKSNYKNKNKQINLWLDSFSEPRLQRSQTLNKQKSFNAEGVKGVSFQK